MLPTRDEIAHQTLFSNDKSTGYDVRRRQFHSTRVHVVNTTTTREEEKDVSQGDYTIRLLGQ